MKGVLTYEGYTPFQIFGIPAADHVYSFESPDMDASVEAHLCGESRIEGIEDGYAEVSGTEKKTYFFGACINHWLELDVDGRRIHSVIFRPDQAAVTYLERLEAAIKGKPTYFDQKPLPPEKGLNI